MRDKDELKQSLSLSDIEKILQYFNIDYGVNSQGDLQMQTACHNAHGGSHKLYYYPESQSFHCFTDCAESFDVYDLVMKVNNTRHIAMNFNESFKTVADIMGINLYQPTKRKVQFGNSHGTISDWDFIHKLAPRKAKEPKFEPIDEGVLNQFPCWYTEEWIEENISPETHEKFGIRFNPDYNQTIIPHYNIDNILIGIRVRNWRSVEKGKYLPLYHKGRGYQHALGYNLYGIHLNKETVQRKKKVMLVESEKSTMKAESFFGEDNFVLSLCGSTLNQFQAELILSMGVEKVILAPDKDYISQPDSVFKDKVKKMARHFINKAQVTVIMDTRNVMDYQECIMDREKDEIINIMNYNQYEINDLEELE